MELTRREFIGATVASTALLAATGLIAQEKKGDIPYRTLGRTGEKVSAIGVGGFHIGIPKDEN